MLPLPIVFCFFFNIILAELLNSFVEISHAILGLPRWHQW